uniref:Uncharacterized protein n=1 Tax=Rhizophora mucronata TaxID=61149 RepID=A0A2P2NNW9_RHIMU
MGDPRHVCLSIYSVDKYRLNLCCRNISYQTVVRIGAQKVKTLVSLYLCIFRYS